MNEDRKIRLVSIDIGRKNFAQYIEEFSYNSIIKFRKRFDNKEPRNSIIKDMVLSGQRIQTGVYKFSDDEIWSDDGRLGLLKHLESFLHLWESCDIFIIEKQFSGSFGRRTQENSKGNTDAIKIGEATYMWFLERYHDRTLMYFGSQYKTQILGAGKMNKTQRKKWSTEKAEEYYRLRNDKDMIKIYELSEFIKGKRNLMSKQNMKEIDEKFGCTSDDAIVLKKKIIEERQKLDDISDAFTQSLAFKFKMLISDK